MKNLSFSQIRLYSRIIYRKIRVKIIYLVQSYKISNNPVEILFVANAYIPTLQLSFLNPLKTASISYEVLTEQQLKDIFGREVKGKSAQTFFLKKIISFHPKIIIFCRYNGPHTQQILDYCFSTKIPTIFHIDDDLLNIPIELGVKKYQYHNDPLRHSTVKLLLSKANLVYCSNARLIERFKSLGFQNNFYSGSIYAAGRVLCEPTRENTWKLGYMGFDHDSDFSLVVPHLVKLLDHYPLLSFDLFGPIKLPDALKKFGGRVTTIEAIEDYSKFMKKLATLKWSIAICPLANTPFNAVKSNTKWVEYTSIGAAVVATTGTIYDECCENDCGVLTKNIDWYDSIRNLLLNDLRRYTLARNAQEKLLSKYSESELIIQINTAIKYAQRN